MADEMMSSPGNGRRRQMRKVREGGFTEAKRQIVLDHLAGCCNVRRAAAAAGVSAETVNYHRRRDPVFAEQCAEAIETGYEALDSAMLERAARGGHYAPGGTIVPGAETVDTELALRLLGLRHRAPGRRTGNGGPRPQRVSEAELNAAILAKLDLLGKRALKREKGSPSTGSGKPEKGTAPRLRSGRAG